MNAIKKALTTPKFWIIAVSLTLLVGYEGLIRHRLSPRASTTRLWLGRVSARVDTA